MKKAIRFMEFGPIALIISLILIIGGFVGTVVQGGYNLGIDFVGGYNQQIQFAPVAFSIEYIGSGKIVALIQNEILTLNIQETDKNENFSFVFKDYATIGLLTDDIAKIAGITVNSVSSYNKGLTSRLMNTDYDIILNNSEVLNVNIKLENANEVFVTKAKIAAALTEFGRFSIQTMGTDIDQKFMIKINNKDAKALISKNKPVVAADTAETSSADTAGLSASEQDQIELKIKESLNKSFESDAMLFQKKDFIGSTYSKEIANGAFWSVVLAILLILVYVSVRFKIIYAVAAIIALVHDCAIMLGVIGVFQIEFNSVTIAAILTILGYSINDTIVVFDRIRENFGLIRDMDRKQIINFSITQTLSRTLITSLTTLLAVIAIFIVSNGVIRDFALNLIVGIVSGTYSSIFIAAVIVLFGLNLFDKQQKIKQEDKISGFKTGTGVSKAKTVEKEVIVEATVTEDTDSTETEQPKKRRKKKS